MTSRIRRALALWLVLAPQIVAAQAPAPSNKTPVLDRGVHLLVDDLLVARSTGVERKVLQPARFLTEPIVTGREEHQN